MIIDTRSLPAGHRLSADVCVIGAGAAGLTVAQELARDGLGVIVVESGDRSPRHATQQLYRGIVSGRPYYALDACRFRLLGGTTSQWGGWCRPLDAIDFASRDRVPDSGWPFPKRELEAGYRRAHQVCGLGSYEYDAPGSTGGNPPGLVPRDDRDFHDTIFRIRPIRFGQLFGGSAHECRTATMLLNANVLEVTTDRTGRTVTDVRLATLRGNALAVRAAVFVLCAGGIENARILLCSSQAGRPGIGNEHDLVGRYFSDHLHVPIGVIRPRNGEADFYRVREEHGVGIRGAIALSEQCRSRTHQLGFAVTLHDAHDPNDVLSLAQTKQSYRSLQTLGRALLDGRKPNRLPHHVRNVLVRLPEAGWLAYRRFSKRPARTLVIGCRAEQTPNPDSRVTLSEQRDRLGMPRVRLEWKLAAQDLEGVRRAQEMLSSALRHQSLEMFPCRTTAGTGWADAIAGGAHHMGTTRMHGDPRRGVVDADCRVHGVTNLYVAGSSVFPTGGWAPPTLTIVALALRLAVHLKNGGRPSVS